MSHPVVIQNRQERRTVVYDRSQRQSIIYERAAMGPPGPAGPAGSGYIHDQPVASDTWTINHNLGVKPVVEAFTPGGLLMLAEVLHTSVNQTVISFNTPTAGFARLV